MNQAIGRTTGRLMRALALSDGNYEASIAFSEAQNWIEKNAIVEVLKAGVGGLTSGSLPSANEAVADFLAALRPYSILSRLERVRKVPSRVRTIAFGAGATAYVVGERQNIPMSKAALDGLTVEPKKIAALTVATNELLNSQAQGVDQSIADDLAAAVGEAEDAAFFLPTVAGSILNGAPNAASAGATIANIDTDLQKAVELLLAAGGKLQDAMWVLSPEAAAKVGGLRGTGGALAFPDLGPNGGQLLKLPAITSERADGYLGLIDQRGVLTNSDVTTQISLARNTTIQMSDSPTNAPTAPVQFVSMFTTESTAFKAVLLRGWQTRAGAGAYIAGGIW